MPTDSNGGGGGDIAMSFIFRSIFVLTCCELILESIGKVQLDFNCIIVYKYKSISYNRYQSVGNFFLL